ncbi:MAG: YezD family protein [Clostridia bacterium]|nr:YezD family protein [Clostridia bacterium]
MSEREQKTPIAISEEKVLEAIRSIKFGTVTLTIQNNKVVQIDKTEKVRLDLKKWNP